MRSPHCSVCEKDMPLLVADFLEENAESYEALLDTFYHLAVSITGDEYPRSITPIRVSDEVIPIDEDLRVHVQDILKEQPTIANDKNLSENPFFRSFVLDKLLDFFEPLFDMNDFQDSFPSFDDLKKFLIQSTVVSSRNNNYARYVDSMTLPQFDIVSNIGINISKSSSNLSIQKTSQNKQDVECLDFVSNMWTMLLNGPLYLWQLKQQRLKSLNDSVIQTPVDSANSIRSQVDSIVR